jgi:four helix bundle protein
MESYRQLIVWQVADDLVFQVYQVTKDFPGSELYGMVSQLRRAAVSIPCNIVEGAGRQGKNETRHFVNIALGSFAETEYLLQLSHRLGYLNEKQLAGLATLTSRLGALLWKFFKSF